MLEVGDALASVLRYAERLPSAEAPLTTTLGRRVSGEIVSDVDSPPYDKALMDGYAIRRADLREGTATELQVLEEVTAGETPRHAVSEGQATRIMTGAPIPEGADLVVMVEQTETSDLPNGQQRVVIRQDAATPAGGNILLRGASMQRGEVVLRAGDLIRPVEIGLLAELGRSDLSVTPAARVAVIATGDELLGPDEPPRPGAIRNSNGPMLQALARAATADPATPVVARDNLTSLTDAIERQRDADVVLLSGGVSAGVRDLAPAALEACGVENVFHKVRLKPGKPLYFGVRRRGDRPPTLYFGLPGNPVSGLVCFRLFVLPAIRALHGETLRLPSADLQTVLQLHGATSALLTCGHAHRGGRPTFFPATIDDGDQIQATTATPLPWRGSADLYTLTRANGLIYLPPESADFQPGDSVQVIPL